MIVSLVAAKLGLTEDRVATVIAATLKSAYITFGAMFVGLAVDAVSQGNTTPTALLAYLQAHWFAWAITNVLAPAFRGWEASQANLPPSKE